MLVSIQLAALDLACSRLGDHSISQMISQYSIWQSLHVAARQASCRMHFAQIIGKLESADIASD